MEIDINGIKYNYWIYGKGRPLVTIHGYGINHRVMEGFLELFFNLPENNDKKKKYSRLYFDLPGMGTIYGANKIKNADHMLDSVSSFIDNVIGKEPFILIGYSYGGYLARAIATRIPERVEKLFLLCPVVIPDKRIRNLPKHTIIERDNHFINSLSPKDAEQITKSLVIQNRRTWKRYLEEIKTGLLNVDTDFIKRYYREGYAFSFDRYREGFYFDNYEKPTLILTGKQDSIVGWSDILPILENYPRATFIVLDGAGHSLQIEQEEKFNSILRYFLR